MVVGLVGLYGFGMKFELVALCSRVLAGPDPAATEPCLVPLGTLFALPVRHSLASLGHSLALLGFTGL